MTDVTIAEAEAPRPQAMLGYRQVRERTERLASPLSAEDQTAQSMPDASPTKWHLAHTSWFFETFLLQPWAAGYRRFHPAFGYMFNSYYEAAGPRHPRPQRGMITRPVGGRGGRLPGPCRHGDGAAVGRTAGREGSGDGRAGSSPRAATPGAVVDGRQASPLAQPAGTCLRPRPRGGRGGRAHRRRLGRLRRRSGRGRPRRGRLLLRQRDSPPRRAPGPLRAGRHAGDGPGSGWRSSTTAATAARSCGSPRGGRPPRPRAGRRRCTGRTRMEPGGSSPWPVSGPSTRPSRCAT